MTNKLIYISIVDLEPTGFIAIAYLATVISTVNHNKIKSVVSLKILELFSIKHMQVNFQHAFSY